MIMSTFHSHPSGGSTTLFEYLIKHPEVRAAVVGHNEHPKERMYFSELPSVHTIQYYESRIHGNTSEGMYHAIDITPSYIQSQVARIRIKQTYPFARNVRFSLDIFIEYL